MTHQTGFVHQIVFTILLKITFVKNIKMKLMPIQLQHLLSNAQF